MNKEEIIKKLKLLNLDKSKYLVISGASLVCHGILDDTSDIDLSCRRDYYDEIDWETTTGLFDTEIKYFDVFEIGPNFYTEERDDIEGFPFMTLKDCLELKRRENKPKDKKLIKILEDYLNNN